MEESQKDQWQIDSDLPSVAVDLANVLGWLANVAELLEDLDDSVLPSLVINAALSLFTELAGRALTPRMYLDSSSCRYWVRRIKASFVSDIEGEAAAQAFVDSLRLTRTQIVEDGPADRYIVRDLEAGGLALSNDLFKDWPISADARARLKAFRCRILPGTAAAYIEVGDESIRLWPWSAEDPDVGSANRTILGEVVVCEIDQSSFELRPQMRRGMLPILKEIFVERWRVCLSECDCGEREDMADGAVRFRCVGGGVDSYEAHELYRLLRLWGIAVRFARKN